MQESGRQPTGIQAKREMVRRYMSDMIIGAAAKVFGTAGYHGASMEHIAREADISPATIYQYFKNKQDLYLQVLFTVLDGLKDAAARAIEHNPDPLLRLRSFIYNRIEFFLSNPAFYQLALFQRWNFILEHSAGEYDELARRYIEYMGMLRSLLEEVGRERSLQDNLNLDKIAYFLLEVTHAAVYHRHATGSADDVDRETDLILNLFVQGLSEHGVDASTHVAEG